MPRFPRHGVAPQPRRRDRIERGLRLKSAALTGGLANPAVALLELAGSLLTALLAVALPVLAVILVPALCIVAFRAAGRVLFGRRRAAGEPGWSP